MSAHTPGPWVVCSAERVRVAAGDFLFLQRNPQKALLEERQANARLIAAAPDLLEAVKSEICSVLCDCCSALRAVVAKAEGRP